jgi:hypothetical protein
MKNRLALLEARLQALIEQGAARLFLFGDNQDDLGSRLVSAMKANIHAQEDGTFWAPNLYFLVLNPDQALAFQNDQSRLDELAALLVRVGAQADLRFASLPVVKTLMEPALRADEVQILAKYNLDLLPDTSILAVEAVPAANPVSPDAYLIVDGGQVFPLVLPVLNIGRSASNDLVLDDPKVSRSHAQIRLINGHFTIFDLDSTGGTTVNDQRITQSVLYPGDVISLAGVTLIFGQETSRSGETQEYIPPEDGSSPSLGKPLAPGGGV